METFYEELTYLVRSEQDDPLTIDTILHAEDEMKKRGYEPAIVRAHPEDVSRFWESLPRNMFVTVERLDNADLRWSNITIIRDVRRAIGRWVMETEAAVTRKAIE